MCVLSDLSAINFPDPAIMTCRGQSLPDFDVTKVKITVLA